jgi:hypothetical protein
MDKLTIPNDFPVICLECRGSIGEDYFVAHMRWHEFQDARFEMAHAHQENLIDRMHTAEKQVEALLARVHFLERKNVDRT